MRRSSALSDTLRLRLTPVACLLVRRSDDDRDTGRLPANSVTTVTTIHEYLNDRPYVSLSMMSVAMTRTLRNAVRGDGKERAELAGTPIDHLAPRSDRPAVPRAPEEPDQRGDVDARDGAGPRRRPRRAQPATPPSPAGGPAEPSRWPRRAQPVAPPSRPA
ncbi:MAG: hypothetical protein OXG35_30280, partial [Acidobacteria bacterium]|nr:hypothetical protein [Acidobacteriota bacterium]